MTQSKDMTAHNAPVGPATESPRQARSLERPSRLMNRHFVLLWQGQAVSQLGSHISSIAIVFLIKHATESATIIGLMKVFSSIPAVILGVIAGTFSDRYSRRKIIIYSDIARGIVVLSLAVLLYMMPDATDITIIWIFWVAVCMSMANSFFGPAISAAIPDLVPQEKVARANTLRQMTGQLALFVGQGLGGMLFRLLGAPLLILINGVTYLFSALTEAFIKIPQNIPEKSNSWKGQYAEFKNDIAAGFRYVWGRKGLRYLFYVSAFSTFFTMPIILLLPFYVEDFLKVKLDWYGYLLAMYGAGIFIGSLCAGFVKLAGQTRRSVIILFMVVGSVTAGMLGLTHNPVTAITLVCVIGVMSGFNGIAIVTILQISTPTDIRGRVFGFLNTVSASAAPIGMGLGGIIFDQTGQSIPLIYGSCSVIMALLSIVVAMNRPFRDLLAYESAEEKRDVSSPHERRAT